MVETDSNTPLPPPRDLIVVGAGGFAPEGVWVAEDSNAVRLRECGQPAWNILGFAAFDPAKQPSTLYSYPILGTPAEAAARFAGSAIYFICMIGNNRIREAMAREAEQLGWTPVALVHPTVVVARGAAIGPGAYVGAGSIVSPGARVGAHVVINNHVSVGHDCVMEDFSQASPGARISGGCVVGRSAFLGSNAALLPGCRVGEGAVVGANSVVLRSVAPHTTVMGVPAKIVAGPANRERSE